MNERFPSSRKKKSTQESQQSANARELLQKQAGRYAEKIMTLLQDAPLSKNELLSAIGLSNHLTNKVRHIDPLLSTGWISYTVPENPTAKSQKYKITSAGKRLLQLINQK